MSKKYVLYIVVSILLLFKGTTLTAQVQLESFNASRIDSDATGLTVKFSWTTSSENNTEFFIVEKSNDLARTSGPDEIAGSLTQASGNSLDTEIYYSTTITISPNPLFYSLKVIYNDGSSEEIEQSIQIPDQVNGTNYVLADQDNFDLGHLDGNKWAPNCLNGLNGELAKFLPENLEFANDPDFANGGDPGSLIKFTAKRENIDGVHPFTSAAITSFKSYRFGYYILRFSTPFGKGLWPAWWFQFGDPNDEIDMFEIAGDQTGEFHTNIFYGRKKVWDNWPFTWHYGQNSRPGIELLPLGDLSSPREISFKWEPGGILSWFIDGTWKRTTTHNFGYSMNMILDLAISKGGGDTYFTGPPNSQDPYPKSFNVDFMKYYVNLDCYHDLYASCGSRFDAPDPTSRTGRRIFLPGSSSSGCEMTIRGGTPPFELFTSRDLCEFIASQEINIQPGFEAQYGSYFIANVVNCGSGFRLGSPGAPNSDEERLNKELAIELYPNPTTAIFSVKLLKGVLVGRSLNIEITDSYGSLVLKQSVSSNQDINIAQFSNGIYFVKISNTEYNHVFKIVKQ